MNMYIFLDGWSNFLPVKQVSLNWNTVKIEAALTIASPAKAEVDLTLKFFGMLIANADTDNQVINMSAFD